MPDQPLTVLLDWSEALVSQDCSAAFGLDRLGEVLPALLDHVVGQARLERLPGQHQFLAVGEVLAPLDLAPDRGVVRVCRGDLFPLSDLLADLLVLVAAMRLAVQAAAASTRREKRSSVPW
jgi:hypothetical protein